MSRGMSRDPVAERGGGLPLRAVRALQAAERKQREREIAAAVKRATASLSGAGKTTPKTAPPEAHARKHAGHSRSHHFSSHHKTAGMTSSSAFGAKRKWAEREESGGALKRASIGAEKTLEGRQDALEAKRGKETPTRGEKADDVTGNEAAKFKIHVKMHTSFH